MRFLFCSLGNPGFLYSSIALARALEARGHEVAFVTATGAASLLQEHGFKRLPRGPKDGESFQVENWWLAPAVSLQVRHIEHALTLFSPDALVGQMLTLGGHIMAERAQLPLAVLGQAAYLWPFWEGDLDQGVATNGSVGTLGPCIGVRSTTLGPCIGVRSTTLGPCIRVRSTERMVWRYKEMATWYQGARERLGMPEIVAHPRETPLLGDLFLLRSVPELEGDLSALPSRVHAIGACLWEPAEAPADIVDWLQRAHAERLPVIYVQHGRSFDQPGFWAALVEGLRREPLRVVASVGRMDAEMGDIPDNFLVRPHVPQALALRHAQAVIASGNSTVALGALTSGLPSLLIPGGSEQPDVAERCAAAGASLLLPPSRLSPGALRDALRTLLADPAPRASAHALQRAFAKHDDLAHACACLERLATTRAPVLRSDVAVSAPG